MMMSDDSFEPSHSVDLLQNRARQISNKSLESTQRMVGLVDHAKETGTKTLAALDEQREKLQKFEEVNDEIREEVRETENVLAEMEKCCGLFVLPWKRPKSLSKADKGWKKGKEKRTVSEQPQLVIDESSNLDFPRITNDGIEAEANENLMYVHDSVRSLKNMAAGMNREVRDHNKLIDKLALKADGNDQRVQSATQRTDNIRKS